MANINENRKLMDKQINTLRKLNENFGITKDVAESIVLALKKYAQKVNEYKYNLPTESRHLPKLIAIIFKIDKIGYTDIKQLARMIITHLDHYAKNEIDPDVYGLPIDNNMSMKAMTKIIKKLIK